MKLSKTARKIDNNVRKALNQAKEQAFEDQIKGFNCFSHSCQWDCFPGSLIILCQFDTQNHLELAESSDTLSYFQKSIQHKLLKVGIVLKDVRQNVKLALADPQNGL